LKRISLIILILFFIFYPLCYAGEEQPAGSSNTEEESSLAGQQIIDVVILGNKNIPTGDIMKVVKVKPGVELNTDQIKTDLQAIYDTGYFTDVKFDPKVTKEGVTVVYRVLENPVVEKIEFSGNKEVGEEKLKELITIKQGEVLNTNALEESLKKINSYYNDELGYVGLPSHIKDISSKEGVVKIIIEEGLPVTEVNFSGNTKVTSNDLLNVITTRPGKLLCANVIQKDLKAIAQLYDERGYVLDEPLTAEPTPEGKVTFIITEAKVEDIIITGNTKTKTNVIMREIRTKKGDVIEKKVLQEDMRRLQNLEFFEDLNIVPKPTGKPGYVILEIQVKETKTGMAIAGIGFSGGSRHEGLTGSLEVRERNLFGTGRAISVSFQRGEFIQNYNLYYREPYITKKGSSISFSLFSNTYEEQRESIQDVPGQKYALFTDRRRGGMITYEHPFSDYVRGFASIKISNIETVPTPSSDYPIIAPDTGKGKVRSIILAGVRDTRDNIADPLKGSYQSLSVERAGVFGGTYDFTKVYFDVRKYIGMWKEHILAVRMLAGTSTSSLPLSEQFYLGGNNTLRAYEEGEFVGDQLILFQTEYRFPLVKSKNLQGAIFIDAGNVVYRNTSTGLFDNFKVDEGIGIRIKIPAIGIGVIRIDFGFNNREGGNKTTVGIGHTF